MYRTSDAVSSALFTVARYITEGNITCTYASPERSLTDRIEGEGTEERQQSLSLKARWTRYIRNTKEKMHIDYNKHERQNI